MIEFFAIWVERRQDSVSNTGNGAISSIDHFGFRSASYWFWNEKLCSEWIEPSSLPLYNNVCVSPFDRSLHNVVCEPMDGNYIVTSLSLQFTFFRVNNVKKKSKSNSIQLNLQSPIQNV